MRRKTNIRVVHHQDTTHRVGTNTLLIYKTQSQTTTFSSNLRWCGCFPNRL